MIAAKLSLVSSNERLPVVGVLAMPIVNEDQPYAEYTKSKVSVNYLRWLEASGANSIIIQPWDSESQIDFILSKVNGVLIQGGDIFIREESIYFKVVKHIYDRVKAYKEEGTILPLIGICHGFEIFNVIQGGMSTLESFDAWNIPSPLIFQKEHLKTTRLFSLLSDEDMENLLTKRVTPEFHHRGTGITNFIRNKSLYDFFRATTLALDSNSKIYIASIEAYDYPIYGVQFHPEKVSFDRNERHNIPQTFEAISIMRKLGNFFVQETKRNSNLISEDEYSVFERVDTFHEFPTLLKNSYYYIFNKSKRK